MMFSHVMVYWGGAQRKSKILQIAKAEGVRIFYLQAYIYFFSAFVATPYLNQIKC